ncbi:MAG: hypothetical protein LPJ89_04175 [Hymenobacteraceae bacterium]|nr:hypothetical protein [Hymenobacteraceae bacterium]MDX5396698.1 hypothetical protein [Hymenobacteraceae bacterium]MDX5442961.1 hypothetical protein [Hymenobacteraceae bacterium]MDX5512758.1 hypothetical protein [Hymenobacteraceae bacterium]
MIGVPAPEAFAQISDQNEWAVNRQTRQSLRKAEDYKAVHKKSHLNTDVYQYKRGETGHKQKKYTDGRDRYRFNSKGKPIRRGLFRNLFRKKRH